MRIYVEIDGPPDRVIRVVGDISHLDVAVEGIIGEPHAQIFKTGLEILPVGPLVHLMRGAFQYGRKAVLLDCSNEYQMEKIAHERTRLLRHPGL